MKERYKQVIWRMYDDMRQIPLAISGLGAASAFAGSYINAYKDIEPAWQYMNIILDGLKNIDTYENIIKTNKDCDKVEIKGQIEWYWGEVCKAIDEFDLFVAERKANKWQ